MMGFWKRWGRPKAVEAFEESPSPVAILSDEDRLLVAAAADHLQQAQRQLQLMALAHKTVWWNMRKSYQFPEEVDYVPATGEVFARLPDLDRH